MERRQCPQSVGIAVEAYAANAVAEKTTTLRERDPNCRLHAWT